MHLAGKLILCSIALVIGTRECDALNAQAEKLYQRSLFDCQSKRGQDSAIKEINGAVALDPDNGLYLLQKGAVLHLMEEDEQALEPLNKAAKLIPTTSSVWISRALVLASLAQPEQALRDADKAISLADKKNKLFMASLYRDRSSVLTQLNRLGEAEQDLTRALELDPANAVIRGRRINIGVRNKHWPQVIADTTMNLKFGHTGSHSSYDLYLVRGDAYKSLKDYHKALADYKLAASLWPDARFAHQRLIQMYGLLGDKEAAVLEQTKLRALDADFAP